MGGFSDYGGDFIFNYAYPISFIGGILYAIISLANLNLADILANKAASVFINIMVGIAGLVSLSYWFQYDMPLVSGIVNSSITTFGKDRAPKPQK
jgi:uncharacterized membrane protein YdcZ (DUF606 family)